MAFKHRTLLTFAPFVDDAILVLAGSSAQVPRVATSGAFLFQGRPPAVRAVARHVCPFKSHISRFFSHFFSRSAGYGGSMFVVQSNSQCFLQEKHDWCRR